MINFRRSFSYLKLHAKSFFRSKSGIFFMLLLPVLFILLFGSIFGSSSEQKVTLAVQDNSHSNYTKQFMAVLNESGLFNLNLVPQGSNISKYMQKNSIDQGIVIPKNFTTDLSHGKGYVNFIYNPGDPQSQAWGQTIENILLRMSSNGTATVQVNQHPVTTNIPKSVDYYLPGLMGFTMINAIFAMVYIVPAYRKKKIFRQLELSGLTKSEWLLAMLVFYFALTLISDLILYAAGYALFGINLSISASAFLLTLLTIFIGLIMFLSIGLLAGLLTKKEETASLIANVIFFPMMFLSGVFFPQSLMPGYLVSVSNLFPLTYLIKVMVELLLYNEIMTTIPYIMVLGAISVGLFFASAVLAKRVDLG